MIGSLPSIHVDPFPVDVEWQIQLYSRLSSMIRKAADAIDAIERGRSEQWITIWRVPVEDGKPDLASAAPCSISSDFLARQLDEVWYYVRIHTEVAGQSSDTHLRCKTDSPRSPRVGACGGSCGACGAQCGSRPTEENNRLLRSLDSVAALATISDERSAASRDDADKWHSECLIMKERNADLEIENQKLRSALEDAVANQAPVIDDAIAEKLGGKAIEALQVWSTTPDDKGYAAMALQAILKMMVSFQDDDELKRLLLKRHRAPFQGVIDAFNAVAKASNLPGRLGLPSMPKLPRRRQEAVRGR